MAFPIRRKVGQSLADNSKRGRVGGLARLLAHFVPLKKTPGARCKGRAKDAGRNKSLLPTRHFNVQSSLALASVDVFLNAREPPCMLHRQNKPFPPHRLESCCKERVLTSLICVLHSILHHNKLAI